MKNPFFPLVTWVYRKIKHISGKKYDSKIYKTLLQLYPMENGERLYDNFQIRKLTFIITFLVIGIVSAICLHLCSRIEGKLAEGAQLIRNEKGVGDYQVTLRAVTENWDREIPFLVKERELTNAEEVYLKEELYHALPETIRNENMDLDHVAGDLNLISTMPGYPYNLTWNSSNSERISAGGKVNRKGVGKEGEKVSLVVTVTGGQERTSFTYEILLLPETLDEEEIFFRALEGEILQTDLEARSQKQIILPDYLMGKGIKWKKIKQDNSIFIFTLFFLGSLLIGSGMESDLQKSCKKRKYQLALDYSEFVSKLRLYLSAGLTVKNAFLRMTGDYAKWQAQGILQGNREKEQWYLLEEMQISCHQLENGVMEEQVYQDFGKRCGEMRYRRLSFLLAVHLKQGNDQLLMMLAKEADDAQEERKNLAKKAGDEAGTKLLLPMMLMLVVVMLLVLLPAYMGFGSI
ncbi:immunoglobulin-like domain-containing protein [Parablautia muri]|uniref:Atrophied bacterial Ig domain-containing protein n=1 Tax=Parablautia muri TaxID=2320879 RepID=A0A9X5BJM4_9FIRM|nr:immunoglobulin-like domain-containing protein [Parablautia muri]NBJ94192.1 hypothetical protein [Parablautia muri]